MKKDEELNVTVITLRWFHDIQTEIETFLEKEEQNSPVKHVRTFKLIQIQFKMIFQIFCLGLQAVVLNAEGYVNRIGDN